MSAAVPVVPEAPPPLSQGVAYGLVLGFGLAFAALVNVVVWANRRYLGEDTMQFLTARKTVKTGLVASGVTSSWIYVSTLLNSCRLVYFYGLSVVWWFAFATTIQIITYSILAIELKRRAPRANTILEVIRVRFGPAAHLTMLFQALGVQIIVTCALLLGASAAITAITGANTIALNFLIPLGVVFYSLLGGLKATFAADWIHKSIIFGVTIAIMFKVVAVESLPVLGSPGKLWDLLTAAEGGAIGAYKGSFLTMDSGDGLLLAGILIVTGYTAVFGDPAYGQKAIAGRPEAVVKGYFIGAIVYAAIPLCLSSTVAYVAITLQGTQYWPQPNGLTAIQANNGLMLPLAAQAVAGKAGSIAVMLAIFMAVTSSFSSELMAISSVLAFDVYKPYVNPAATDRSLKLVSRLAIVGYGIFSGAFATGLSYSNISMGWLLEALGVMLGGVVVPMILPLISNRVPKWFMIFAPWAGTVCGIASWIGITKGMQGEVNVTTLLANWSMFTGCVVSIVVPLLIWAIQRPFNHNIYNWEDLFLMKAVRPRLSDVNYVPGEMSDLGVDWDPVQLKKAIRLALILSATFFLIFLIIIPFPMYGTHYIFSRKFFTAFTIIVFIFGWLAFLTIFLYPIIEGRHDIRRVLVGAFNDMRGKHPAPVTAVDLPHGQTLGEKNAAQSAEKKANSEAGSV